MTLLVLAAVTAPGCCLTNHMWNGARDIAVGIRDARIDEAGVLAIDLQYTDGSVLRVNVEPPRWPDDFSRLETTWDALPGAEPVPKEALRVQVYVVGGPALYLYTGTDQERALISSLSISGSAETTSGRIWLPTPLDWSRGSNVGRVLLTPVTAVIDIIASPMAILWVLGTAGGHGDYWVPWCNGEPSDRLIVGSE